MRPGGWHHTEESRAKISRKRMGINYSEETRKKMSEAKSGKPLSIEHRKKIGTGLKGTHNCLGHVVNHETRMKISAALKGALSYRWKGGRWKSRGYLNVYRPDHPHASPRGYVREHRLVMEAHLGRILLPSEVVHHINGICDDNRIENLMLFSSNTGHMKNHKEKRRGK